MMRNSDYLNVIVWINISVCLPFTFLVLILCYLEKSNTFPVIYYMNVLVSNLIQLITLTIVVAKPDENISGFKSVIIIFCCGAMVSLCFRMFIALERYFLISWPQLGFIRQTKDSVIICVLVWMFCCFLVPNLIVFQKELGLIILVWIFASVYLISLVGALCHLPAAPSLSAEEKGRIVVIFYLVLVNYILIMLLTITWFRCSGVCILQISMTMFLLSPVVDLVQFVFMCKGPSDKLLLCLCYCRIEKTAGNNISGSSA